MAPGESPGPVTGQPEEHPAVAWAVNNICQVFMAEAHLTSACSP